MTTLTFENELMNKILVDTNVLIYSIDQDSKYFDQSSELLIFQFDLTDKYKPRGLKFHDFEIVSIGLANKIKKFASFNSKDISHIKEIEILDLKQ